MPGGTLCGLSTLCIFTSQQGCLFNSGVDYEVHWTALTAALQPAFFEVPHVKKKVSSLICFCKCAEGEEHWHSYRAEWGVQTRMSLE